MDFLLSHQKTVNLLLCFRKQGIEKNTGMKDYQNPDKLFQENLF
jgi:hypothetical protein